MPEINYGSPTVSGNVQVDLTQQIASPSSTQTLKYAQAATTGSNVTLATVTAGKTAYVYGWQVQKGGAVSCWLYETDGSTLIVEGYDSEHFSMMSSIPFAVYASGENIIGKATTGGEMTIFYWEE